MTSRGIIGAAMLFVLSLAGCGGGDAPNAAPKASATSTSTTVTAQPSPTPTYASENQVASVIAGGEEKWREVKEESGECRIGYVLKDKSGMLEIERMTCYTKELTAGVTAEIAIRDLQALDVPPSMDGLVDETVVALQMLVDANLENACGPAMTEPKDSEECSSALGTRSMAYQLLTSVLDKWKPYV